VAVRQPREHGHAQLPALALRHGWRSMRWSDDDQSWNAGCISMERSGRR
jgi:hypothetical protein